MKIYLNDEQEYINVSFISIMKAHLLSGIVWGILFYAILTIILNLVNL